MQIRRATSCCSVAVLIAKESKHSSAAVAIATHLTPLDIVGISEISDAVSVSEKVVELVSFRANFSSFSFSSGWIWKCWWSGAVKMKRKRTRGQCCTTILMLLTLRIKRKHLEHKRAWRVEIGGNGGTLK